MAISDFHKSVIQAKSERYKAIIVFKKLGAGQGAEFEWWQCCISCDDCPIKFRCLTTDKVIMLSGRRHLSKIMEISPGVGFAYKLGEYLER